MSYSLELDRKPGILSPKALTFSKSQSVGISISKTFIVGNCNCGGVIMPSSSSHNINTITDHYSNNRDRRFRQDPWGHDLLSII